MKGRSNIVLVRRAAIALCYTKGDRPTDSSAASQRLPLCSSETVDTRRADLVLLQTQTLSMRTKSQ